MPGALFFCLTFWTLRTRDRKVYPELKEGGRKVLPRGNQGLSGGSFAVASALCTPFFIAHFWSCPYSQALQSKLSFMPTQNFKILSRNGLPHYLKTVPHFTKQLQTACLDFQNICAYHTWKHTPIGLRPSSLENNTRRIKQTLHASAPFLQQHLLPFSFIFFFPKKALSPRPFSMMWKEMDNRQVAGGWRWTVASFTAIFQEPIGPTPKCPMHFPPDINSWNFCLQRKFSQIYETLFTEWQVSEPTVAISQEFPQAGSSPLCGGWAFQWWELESPQGAVQGSY